MVTLRSASRAEAAEAAAKAAAAAAENPRKKRRGAIDKVALVKQGLMHAETEAATLPSGPVTRSRRQAALLEEAAAYYGQLSPVPARGRGRAQAATVGRKRMPPGRQVAARQLGVKRVASQMSREETKEPKSARPAARPLGMRLVADPESGALRAPRASPLWARVLPRGVMDIYGDADSALHSYKPRTLDLYRGPRGDVAAAPQLFVFAARMAGISKEVRRKAETVLHLSWGTDFKAKRCISKLLDLTLSGMTLRSGRQTGQREQMAAPHRDEKWLIWEEFGKSSGRFVGALVLRSKPPRADAGGGTEEDAGGDARGSAFIEYVAARRSLGGRGWPMVLAAEAVCRKEGFTRLFSAADLAMPQPSTASPGVSPQEPPAAPGDAAVADAPQPGASSGDAAAAAEAEDAQADGAAPEGGREEGPADKGAEEQAEKSAEGAAPVDGVEDAGEEEGAGKEDEGAVKADGKGVATDAKAGDGDEGEETSDAAPKRKAKTRAKPKLTARGSSAKAAHVRWGFSPITSEEWSGAGLEPYNPVTCSVAYMMKKL